MAGFFCKACAPAAPARSASLEQSNARSPTPPGLLARASGGLRAAGRDDSQVTKRRPLPPLAPRPLDCAFTLKRPLRRCCSAPLGRTRRNGNTVGLSRVLSCIGFVL